MLGTVTTGKRALILIVADQTTAASIAEQLARTTEFDAMSCETGMLACELVERQPVDAIVIDQAMPDFDGRELCRLMRGNGIRCPIIMVSATDSDSDLILCLESGANDYLSKPLRFPVFLARLRAHLRGQEQCSEFATFAVGQYRFIPGIRKLLAADGAEIRLTEKESSILKLMCRMRDRAISRDAILCAIWGTSRGAFTHKLETHIHRLRRKLESEKSGAALLATVPMGYCLRSSAAE
jgi:DNA-binding response OmpR family regulator